MLVPQIDFLCLQHEQKYSVSTGGGVGEEMDKQRARHITLGKVLPGGQCAAAVSGQAYLCLIAIGGTLHLLHRWALHCTTIHTENCRVRHVNENIYGIHI